jgi:chromosomal replication initiation ATPase DnaA
MVTELCSYPFCSYPASIGQVKAPNQILRKGVKKNTARDVAIYLTRELSGEIGVDLGKYFGSICGAAVTGRYKQISEKISRNIRLKGRVNRVKNRKVNN